MKKWTTIFKQIKPVKDSLFLSPSNEWICTDFGHTIDSDTINMFIMQPLHTHPDGKALGRAPLGFDVLFVTEEQLKEYFEELPGRDYYQEQRIIEEKFFI